VGRGLNCDRSALMKAKNPREFAAFGRRERYVLCHYETNTHALLNFYVRICSEFA